MMSLKSAYSRSTLYYQWQAYSMWWLSEGGSSSDSSRHTDDEPFAMVFAAQMLHD